MTSGAPDAYVSVRMLGDFAVTIDGEPVRCWRAGKARSLFQYLVVHRGRMVLRDTLHDVLWPYSDRAPGSSSLKVAMHALRRILQVTPGSEGGVRLRHQGFGYLLEADDLWVDAEEFETAMTAGRDADRDGDTDTAVRCFAEAVDLYQGDFLAGESAQWAVEHREWCRSLALHALERLCEHAAEADQLGDLLHWCRRIIAIDPCSEETYRTLIGLHGGRGERGAAQRWYQLCLRRLHDDLGVEPAAETQRAYLVAVGNEETRTRPAARRQVGGPVTRIDRGRTPARAGIG